MVWGQKFPPAQSRRDVICNHKKTELQERTMINSKDLFLDKNFLPTDQNPNLYYVHLAILKIQP